MAAPLDPVVQLETDAPDAPLRHTFIGASEAADLLGEKHFGKGCTRALAYQKTGTPPDIQPDQTTQRAITMRATFRRGHLLEPLGAQFYTEASGHKTRAVNKLIQHPDHPGAACHPDRLIIASDARGSGDLEIKTAAQGAFLNILRNGLPIAYMLQLQWVMWCTGHRFGAFAIVGILSDLPFRHFERTPDLAWQQIFARAVDNFWNTLAHGELPPPLPDPADLRCKVCPYRLSCRGELLSVDDYQQLIAQRDSKRILTPVQNDELNEALADRALIKSEIEALSSESETDPGALQLVTARIKKLMGNEEAALVNKVWKVYLNEHSWSGVDVKRLQVEEPEIYKRYYVSRRPTGTRVLRVYAMHDGKERSNGS